jgi:hypothetical protein
MHFPANAGLIFVTDELTNDRYLFDIGATLSIVPCTASSSQSSPLLKGVDGQRLKDVLRACAAAATWSKELPFVLLGLRTQPREDTGLSPAEAVFGALIMLPNEFLHSDEMSVHSIIKNFSKTLDAPAFSFSRHNSSAELPSELLSTPLVWVRRGGVIPPLHLLYNGPYAVLRCGPRSFTI